MDVADVAHVLAAFDDVEDLLDQEESGAAAGALAASPCIVTANDRALLALATPAPARAPQIRGRARQRPCAAGSGPLAATPSSSGEGFVSLAASASSGMTDSSEKALAPALAFLRNPRNRLSMSPLNISPTVRSSSSPAEFSSVLQRPSSVGASESTNAMDSPSTSSLRSDSRAVPSTDSTSLSSRLAKIGFVHKKTKLKKKKKLIASSPTADSAPNSDEQTAASTPTGQKSKAHSFTPYAQLESSCGGNLGVLLSSKKANGVAKKEEPSAKDDGSHPQDSANMNQKMKKKKKKRMFGTERDNNCTSSRNVPHSWNAKLTEEQVKETF